MKMRLFITGCCVLGLIVMMLLPRWTEPAGSVSHTIFVMLRILGVFTLCIIILFAWCRSPREPEEF